MDFVLTGNVSTEFPGPRCFSSGVTLAKPYQAQLAWQTLVYPVKLKRGKILIGTREYTEPMMQGVKYLVSVLTVNGHGYGRYTLDTIFFADRNGIPGNKKI